MRKRIGLLIVATSLSCLAAEKRRLLVSFHKPSALVIVDEEGTVVWKAKPKIKHPKDCAVTADGNFLCSDYTGVLAIGVDNEVKWRYRIPQGTQNPVAFPTADDCFLIGIEGPTLLREINREGTVLNEVKLSTTHPKVHGQFRMCRRTSDGTYLVPFTIEGALREYSQTGELVRDFGKYRLVVGALRLPNGNTLISYCDGFVEVDRSGKTVWDFMTKRDSTLPFAPMVGIARLKNGNVLAAFYNKKAEIPALVEITPDKEVVYSLKVDGYTRVGHFQLLTDEFKPSPEVLVR